MSLFVLDTSGNKDLLHIKEAVTNKSVIPFNGRGPLAPNRYNEDRSDPGSEEEDDGEYWGLPPPSHDISNILNNFIVKKKLTKVEKEMELAVQMVKSAEASKTKAKSATNKYVNHPNKDLVFPDFDISTGKLINNDIFETNVAVEMEKSNNANLEQIEALPMLRDKKLRDLRRIEREKNKGEGWFNMPATEVTEEVENDLKILQMRSVLNPKHFYKKNDLKVLPKFFQIGTVQHSPLDYYKERDTRRNKKKSLVDELLADAEFQKFTKRKFKEVTSRTDRYAHKRAMKKMKKLKKNK